MLCLRESKFSRQRRKRRKQNRSLNIIGGLHDDLHATNEQWDPLFIETGPNLLDSLNPRSTLSIEMSTDHRLHSHPNLEEDVASDISDSFSQASIPSRLSKTSSRTSFDYEPSPEPSPSRSVTSLTPSMREQAYKTQYGRAINNFSDVYGLPADEEELARLGKSFAVVSCKG